MFIKSQNGFTLCNMANIICLHIQRSSCRHEEYCFYNARKMKNITPQFSVG
ncbi:hypothetical protein GPK96_00205 [Blautia sp. MCC289]|nr:hypothetical protein [Blautia sp. MCC289]